MGDTTLGTSGGGGHGHRFVGHAAVVAGLTFTSRLLGLVRDTVLAGCFGMTVVTDAFWIAFVVPQLFRRLFGEGALTSAFIPAYTGLRKVDRAGARRLAWGCVFLTGAVLVTVVMLMEVGLSWLLYVGGVSEHAGRVLGLTAIMLPYAPMICVVALLGGVLQVHGRFAVPAAAPVFLNVTMILTAWAGSWYWQEEVAIRVVALGVLCAGVVQLVWQFKAASRLEPVTRDLRGGWGLLRPVVLATAPMAAGLAVFQVNALLDSMIAFGLSPKELGDTRFVFFGREMGYPVRLGSVTGLQFAQRLYQFPLGVFGIALATAIFPALSRAAVDLEDRPGVFREMLQKGVRLGLFVGLPATVGLYLVRLPLIQTIFEYKQFTGDDSRAVAGILAGYSTGVWAYIVVHLLTRGFYALKDPKTPVRVALGMVVLNLGLNLSLVWWLGAPALAWSTAVSAMLQAVVLLWLLGRRTAGLVDGRLVGGVARSCVLTVVMGGVLVGVGGMMDVWEWPRSMAPVRLLVLVGVGAGVVLVGARVVGMAELGWLIRRDAGLGKDGHV